MNDIETDTDSELKLLAVMSLGFFLRPRLKRILRLCGWKVVPGWKIKSSDAVGVWGRKPVSKRGLFLAAQFEKPVLNVEDPFLRSVEPGHTGAAPLGLLTDIKAPHFDVTQNSTLEELLQSGDLSDPALLERAALGIETLRQVRLSKYNAWQDQDLPAPGFILVIDQTFGDASIEYGGATQEDFAAMLAAAKTENPEKRILIRSHPVVTAKAKSGYFQTSDVDWRTTLYTDPVNPWDLLERAEKVYCVTSQMGFEAQIAGKKPIVFGQPFYAGWGLSEDRKPVSHRTKIRSLPELFAAALLLYPNWYDPCRDRIGTFEDILWQLDAERRAWRENARGQVCIGLKPWKHAWVSDFLQGPNGTKYEKRGRRAVEVAQDTDRDLVVWAGKETSEFRKYCKDANVNLLRMEDGFLRSVGLGANLIPAASLVVDDIGIYFDSHRPSRLEMLLENQNLTDQQKLRAEIIRKRLIALKLTKYNVGEGMPDLGVPPGKKVILVPGQVEDDASILMGTNDVTTNLELLKRAREQFPEDYIIYKPHPDVEAGLREGQVSGADLDEFSDFTAREMSAADLMDHADIVWTMTSLMGFEALMREKTVYCLGRPFYAGWGLTRDYNQTFERRTARPDLAALVHATLIDYPRYMDPVSGLPCAIEVVIDRLTDRSPAVSSNPARRMRWLAALQYRFRRFAHFWR